MSDAKSRPQQSISTEADNVDIHTPEIQHNPPSLPSSPHPKRVKTDHIIPLSGDMATQADQGNTNPPTTDNTMAQTPTPTSNSVPSASSLPSVSSLLSSNPLPHNQINPTPTNGLAQTQSSMNTLPPLPQQSTMPGVSLLQQPSALITPPAPPLLIKKLSPDATTPTRGSAFAAGYDIYSSANLTLPAKSKALVPTSISMAVPMGTYGRVAPRSGLASKHFLDVGAGVIDADYRGEVKVLMFNFSETDYEIKKGERVAQLVLERILTPDVVVVEELEESVRGAGGFGSTGYI